jgi:myo-inositol 2-dehydrogenase/D-chiro-inositol 1-dehydrogenase
MGVVHAEAISRLPEIELAAVAEQRLEAVVAASHLTASAAIYPTAEAALGHPGLDACLIVTPTDTHAGVVDGALEQGLHVFCEKPLTLDTEESLRLGREASDRGLVLHVGFWRRFCPPLVEAKRHLSAGAIGRPVALRSIQWDAQAPAPAWCAPERSGGIFVDMAVHDIDEVEWLLEDRIVELEGRPLPIADPAIGEAGDFDNANILMRMESGAAATIELSRNGRYADDLRVEILGASGAIFVDTFPWPRVKIGDADGLRTVWEGRGVETFAEGIAQELAAFASAVAAPGSVELPGAEESARATFFALEARQSGTSGKPMEHVPAELG